MLDVVFLISEKYKTFGSSILRGDQLCKMCSEFFPGDDVRFRVAYSAQGISGSFIVFSKMAALTTDARTLQEIRSRGNKLYADYADGIIPSSTAPLMDGFLACSRAQQRFLMSKYPEKRVVHITHHVDLNIPDSDIDHQVFRCGYFGDLKNALFHNHLRDKVDFVNTNETTSEWIEKFQLYSTHYVLRSRRHSLWNRKYWAGFKPFLKGFVAARVGAVVLIEKSDEEAISYLGNDYPFICDSRNLSSVRGALDDMERSFQSERWYRAVDAVKLLKAQIAPAQLRAELEALFFGAS